MAFLNALVNTPDDLEYRVSIRYELENQNISSIFEVLGHFAVIFRFPPHPLVEC